MPERETPWQMIAYLMREAGMLLCVFSLIDSLPPFGGIDVGAGVVVAFVGVLFVLFGVVIERGRD
jgi:hypothetical protein